jgi:hypothetical protein
MPRRVYSELMPRMLYVIIPLVISAVVGVEVEKERIEQSRKKNLKYYERQLSHHRRRSRPVLGEGAQHRTNKLWGRTYAAQVSRLHMHNKHPQRL